MLAGEGQPRAGDAAQQALAITARTFAMANRNRHRREGFDLCDTTHCQVVRPATATTTRAAQATSGRLLLSQGQPAFVFYSASCGGRTESASEVWPGAIDYPGAASVHDDADENEAGWESDVRVQDIERALRAAGLRGERLRDIKVVARNKSNRVAKVRVEGFTPPEMNGHEFRMAVGRVVGREAEKLIPKIRKAVADYPARKRGDYRIWPGPNSNSFIATILADVPEAGINLPPNAMGRDWRGTSGLYAGSSPSRTGVQVSVFGLFGFTLARVEGIELNMLGLVFGFDWQQLALKLPGWGNVPMWGK